MPQQSSVSSKKIDAKPSMVNKKSTYGSLNAIGIGDGEDHFRMISEAAYYRALGRGFNGGDPEQDWLMAEANIDGLLRD
jgi:hypothetical protein